MTGNGFDELIHVIKMNAQHQVGFVKLHAWGYVASYDPNTHSVKCILPTYTDANGNAMMTPWIQLGTWWAGSYNGAAFGVQVCPIGGADASDPAKGEQCFIEIVERDTGAAVCTAFLYSTRQLPPVTNLNPGECILIHSLGQYIRFNQDGTLTMGRGALQPAARKGDTVTINGGLGSALQTALDGRYQLSGSPSNLPNITGSITTGSTSVKLGS